MDSIIHGTILSTLRIGDMQDVMTLIGDITTTIIMVIILITMEEHIIQNQIGVIM